MYEDYLNALLVYIRALNTASNEIGEEKPTLTPWVDHIPVILEGELCGFLRDEVGGEYSYQDVTDKERAWWDARPWRRP